jgi:hypothetical protein
MKIPAEMTIAAAETAIAGLSGSMTDTALTLPTHARYDAAGGEAAIIQMLLTWVRTQHRATLRTYATDGRDKQLESFARQMFGTAAALLADDALSSSGETVFRELRTYALDRLRDLQEPDSRGVSRGQQVEVLCADHLARSTPELLYGISPDGVRTLRGRAAFLDLAKLITRTTMPAQGPAAIDGEEISSIGGALYELFRNTDEHARYDERGDRIRRSLRGIQAKLHRVDRAVLARIVASSPPLSSYCDQLQVLDRDPLRVRLAEISIFDAGPGFAPKWLSRSLDQISNEEELEAINQCFVKHATTKDVSSAGLGLPHVVDILRRRSGFLRIRTGRRSLFVNFATDENKIPTAPLSFKQWRPSRPIHAAAAGTLVTILVPLSVAR